jgi:hypothetical protein
MSPAALGQSRPAGQPLLRVPMLRLPLLWVRLVEGPVRVPVRWAPFLRTPLLRMLVLEVPVVRVPL